MASLFHHTTLKAIDRTTCSVALAAAWTAAPVDISQFAMYGVRTRGPVNAGEINALGARCVR